MTAPRILIVDDEPPIRSLLEVAFSKAGFTVRTACDAQQAMELCAAEPFDAVLSDVRMPGLSGRDLAHWIGSHYPSVKTVLMSGCDLDCGKCGMAGRCRVLPKPFRPAEAVAVMRNALAQGAGA